MCTRCSVRSTRLPSLHTKNHLLLAVKERSRIPRRDRTHCFQASDHMSTHKYGFCSEDVSMLMFSFFLWFFSVPVSSLTSIKHFTHRWSSAAPHAKSTVWARPQVLSLQLGMRHRAHSRYAMYRNVSPHGYHVFAAIMPSTFIAAMNLSPLSLQGSESHTRRVRGFPSMKTILREDLLVLSFFIVPRCVQDFCFSSCVAFFTGACMRDHTVKEGSRVRSTPSDYQESSIVSTVKSSGAVIHNWQPALPLLSAAPQYLR